MVRRAGARKVYLASASPPVKYPNVYGVDMPNKKEFVANGLTDDEVRGTCCLDVQKMHQCCMDAVAAPRMDAGVSCLPAPCTVRLAYILAPGQQISTSLLHAVLPPVVSALLRAHAHLGPGCYCNPPVTSAPHHP